MLSRPFNPPSVDEMPPKQKAQCARLIRVQKALHFLEKVLDAEKKRDAAESNGEQGTRVSRRLVRARIAKVSRKLVNDLLALTQNTATCELLNITELELTRLRQLRELTEEMRIKFRIAVDGYLDDHMPSKLSLLA